MSSEESDGRFDSSGIPIPDIQQKGLKDNLKETVLEAPYLSITPHHSQQSSLSSELHSTDLSSPVSDKIGESSAFVEDNSLPVIPAVREPAIRESTVQEPAVQEPAVQEPAIQESEPLPDVFWEHKSILTCGKQKQSLEQTASSAEYHRWRRNSRICQSANDSCVNEVHWRG
jgi:hypothetical protein